MIFFFKGCPGRGANLGSFWDFLSQKQCLRPLGYCAPLCLDLDVDPKNFIKSYFLPFSSSSVFRRLLPRLERKIFSGPLSCFRNIFRAPNLSGSFQQGQWWRLSWLSRDLRSWRTRVHIHALFFFLFCFPQKNY